MLREGGDDQKLLGEENTVGPRRGDGGRWDGSVNAGRAGGDVLAT